MLSMGPELGFLLLLPLQMWQLTTVANSQLCTECLLLAVSYLLIIYVFQLVQNIWHFCTQIEQKQYFESDFLTEVTVPVLVTLMLQPRNVSSLNSDWKLQRRAAFIRQVFLWISKGFLPSKVRRKKQVLGVQGFLLVCLFYCNTNMLQFLFHSVHMLYQEKNVKRIIYVTVTKFDISVPAFMKTQHF